MSCTYVPTLARLRCLVGIGGRVGGGGGVLTAGIRVRAGSVLSCQNYPMAGRRGGRPYRASSMGKGSSCDECARLPYGSSCFWLLCSADTGSSRVLFTIYKAIHQIAKLQERKKQLERDWGAYSKYIAPFLSRHRRTIAPCSILYLSVPTYR